MLRLIAILIMLASASAYAQTPQGNHHHMGADGPHGTHLPRPTQPGQGAFAAIQEIVELLEADPETNWSKVNVDGLRQHLVDMNNVTLAANVKNEPLDGGIRYSVTGVGPVKDSIRRMVTAHAATMDGVDGWAFKASEIEDGAALTVLVPPKDADKLRGLGFFGVVTRGMHHQDHHLMIARGDNPHHQR